MDASICDAFPERIPDAISSTSHWEPYDGDNGLTFKPKEGYSSEEKLAWLHEQFPKTPADYPAMLEQGKRRRERGVLV
jgi:hypothetical protein